MSIYDWNPRAWHAQWVRRVCGGEDGARIWDVGGPNEARSDTTPGLMADGCTNQQTRDAAVPPPSTTAGTMASPEYTVKDALREVGRARRERTLARFTLAQWSALAASQREWVHQEAEQADVPVLVEGT